MRQPAGKPLRTSSARFISMLAHYGKRSIFAANRPCCLHGVGTGLKIDRSNRR
jgi:hypothetical protein